MAGNSPRPGRRNNPKQGSSVGSGGKRRAGLKGKGRTLKAEERPWHKAYSGPEPLPKRTAWKQEKERRKAEAEAASRRGTSGAGTSGAGTSGAGAPAAGAPAERRAAAAAGAGGAGGTGGARRQDQRVRGAGRPAPKHAKPGQPRSSGQANPARQKEAPELLVGRNPVVEALRTAVPATGLYLARGIDNDERVSELVRTAGDRGIAIMEVSRGELDRLTGGVVHQGVGLQVPPYAYASFEDLLADPGTPGASLLVALDGVTDPRNLGAVIRSAAAFGAHGVVLPARRAAGMTATAWRTSAGAAARLPVAKVTNLTRALTAGQDAGLLVVGLDADADTALYDLDPDLTAGPLLLVIGSEGRGLSRLVAATCDLRVSIPMASGAESLNASVAAAVALAEVTRRRRAHPHASS